MKLRSYLVLSLLLACFAASTQTLISTTLLGTRTKAQLTTQSGLPFIQYGAKFYRITYTSLDVHGALDTVSGLVAVPNDPDKVFPRLVYQHGTSSSKLDVPSYNVLQNGEGSIGLLFAGLGYVSLLPDYLGLGISDGFHPYVHAASEASVALDMLRALPAFNSQYGVHTNNQLFMTGYSQGGHASMALHRAVESDLAAEFSATAAAHLSGPYSIGEVMRGLILSDSVDYFPGYLPNTILSYQTAYGNLFNQVSDIFKAPYAAKIDAFYKGNLALGQLNSELISLLVTNVGDSRPLRMLQDSVVQAVLNDPQHPFNIALRDNNVYAWAPKAPTRIFYCKADDQVPYLNSLLARDSMTARGASSLVAQDVNTNADHGGCVTPALTNTLLFFAGYQQISGFVDTDEPLIQTLALSPNPANQFVQLPYLASAGELRVYAISGRLIQSKQLPAGEQQWDVSGLENGLYFVQFKAKGAIWQGKLVVQH
ncbi:MAG: T9SS type A sorting domain-containing protein [Saprospiraceae bacterium]|nr:T9SS type A sorting domain-containing protein [Saprospiraceae bacterium]